MYFSFAILLFGIFSFGIFPWHSFFHFAELTIEWAFKMHSHWQILSQNSPLTIAKVTVKKTWGLLHKTFYSRNSICNEKSLFICPRQVYWLTITKTQTYTFTKYITAVKILLNRTRGLAVPLQPLLARIGLLSANKKKLAYIFIIIIVSYISHKLFIVK